MTVPACSTLVLWDVDHTLVDTGDLGRRLYEAAILQLTGRPMQQLAEMTGRTDWAILADTLELQGVRATEDVLQAGYQALADAVAGVATPIPGRALPGAPDAIEVLAQADVVQSVVTGNIRPIASAKLDACHLGKGLDLDVGGYGSDGRERASLVRAAWMRTGQKYGARVPADRVFVIGDTPHDIAAAREVGVRSIAVASGSSSVEELRSAGPDAVFTDLTDPIALRSVIFGAVLPAR